MKNQTKNEIKSETRNETKRPLSLPKVTTSLKAGQSSLAAAIKL